jgi:tetratricopeptide (TPR) repeat protein
LVGQLPEAIGQFQEAVRLAPRDLNARLGRYPEAIPLFQAGLRSAPDNPALLHNLAQAYAAVGQSPPSQAPAR